MTRDTGRSKDSSVESTRAVRALSSKQHSKIPWLIGGAVAIIAAAVHVSSSVPEAQAAWTYHYGQKLVQILF